MIGGTSRTRRVMTGGRATLAVGVAAGALAVAGMPSLGQGVASPEPADGAVHDSDWVYTLDLPAGWSVFMSEAGPEGGEDRFDGPIGLNARVGGGVAAPDQTVEQRVAVNREEVTAEGTCTSDPADEQPTTMDGSPGVLWTWVCPDGTHRAINTIDHGMRLRLEVIAAPGMEAQASAALEALRSGFAWKDGDEPDLVAIETAVQGRYETPWHPLELETATLEAAGLADLAATLGWAEYASASETRSAIKFEDGAFILYQAYDGGPWELGLTGRYRLVDDGVFETAGPTDTAFAAPSRWAYTLRDGILVLDVTHHPSLGPNDVVWETAIFETLPFIRVE